MNRSQGSGGHLHPQTFDQVIAQGFPHDMLGMLDQSAMVLPAAGRVLHAPLAAPLPAVATVTRKNQATLSVAEQTTFKNAVVKLVADGGYLTLIQDHMDMSHNMHGSMGTRGLYRFLPWHRRFVVAFERELQRVDAILRPTATDKLSVPYWRWEDPFPAWLAGFLPAKDPVSGKKPPKRKNAAPPAKPSAVDIDDIINHFSVQTTHVPGENDYTKFTYGIEGWGLRPDGTTLFAHNHGHSWVGGIMNNTSTSPTDPIFWMHHAEIDRLWHIWRQAHPTPAPALTGADLIMDPWPESYANLLNIAALGYTYDSLAL